MSKRSGSNDVTSHHSDSDRSDHSGGLRDLERYNEMRDFNLTAEPRGEPRKKTSSSSRRAAAAAKHLDAAGSFVVQKHAARRLHYDFRLELDGVLLSWAVPKGPSLVPGDKRLAVQVEDHPLDYRDFEGTIPKGQYGGGPVIVWDRGTWTAIGDPHAGLEKGHLDFTLDGQKLHGRFMLIRTRKEGEKKPTWLLFKRHDEFAETAGTAAPIVDREPSSVLTERTIEDVLAGVPAKKTATAKTKKTKGRSTKKASAKQKPATSKDKNKKIGGRSAAQHLPPFGSIAPQLATLVKTVPSAAAAAAAQQDWIYEIKYDGYRTMAWLDGGKVQMASRRGHDWTKPYATIADALSRVRARNAIFDGEVAYVLEDGRTSFQKLQNTLGLVTHKARAPEGRAGSTSAQERSRLVYFVFDLLFYDGVDLRNEPLSFRKDKLRTILAGEEPPLKMSDHVEDGAAFFREACKLGLEGIIGKRADRPYVSKRTTDWIKVKCDQRQELVIVGFTSPRGSRKGIGALLLGLAEAGKKRLRYAGKVGTGFSNATLHDLSKRLAPLVIDEPPIANPPSRMKDVTWVKPELVGQVRFSEWTSDGVLRHSSFEGLRLDKAPKEIRREEPTDHADGKPRVQGVIVTHPERVMDAQTRLTKLDLVQYAGEVAESMLPYIAKRPLMLLRCPNGTESSVFRQGRGRRDPAKAKSKSGCFVQKHGGQGLHGANLFGSETSEEAIFVTSPEQIVLLAQNNAVELHGRGSRLPRWDRPDWMVLDLDPDEALPFENVVDAAFEMRDALRTLSLESWVKTTGGKGLHVVVPLVRRYDWPTIRRVSEQIAILMTRAAPSRYVANMSKKARVGKIFVDYLRNSEGATAVLPYSARARPGLTVALPVSWNDLRAMDPREITIATVPKIIARRRSDPWTDLLDTKQSLPRELLEAAL